MSIFDTLHPEIRELLKKEGILKPTTPQMRSFGHIMNMDHTLIIAPTGIGKTEAAVIPIFELLLRMKGEERDVKGFKGIYITPLRALNRDIVHRLEGWGVELGISVGLRHGDTSQKERTRQSRDPPEFLITTPETLQILFTGSRLRKHLEQVRFVVVDEIHDICPNVRGAQLSIVLERLVKMSLHRVLRVGLSATIAPGSIIEVAGFLGGMGRRVKVVRVEGAKDMVLSVVVPSVPGEISSPGEGVSSRDIGKTAVELACSEDELRSILASLHLVEEHQPVLFFVNTRQTAEVLASRLLLLRPDFPMGIHHGSLSKEVRMRMEDDFKSGKLKGLICTSSLELGIDVGFVDHVVQFSSPRETTRLVQRIGRAGHGVGRISHGTVLATKNDDIMESGVIVRRSLDGELEPIAALRNPLAVLANQIMAASMVKGGETRYIEASKFFDVVKRALPFATLKRSVYYRLLGELDELHQIRFDPSEDRYYRKRRTMDYFYENISMLKDEKVFKVIDTASRRPVGTLNEGFVATYIEAGVKFIVRGRPWVVIEIEDDEVIAAPSDDIGAIPSWIGEEIPVPFEVAHEVGHVRDEIVESLGSGAEAFSKISAALQKRYHLERNACDRYLAYVKKQNDSHPVPTHDTITIERHGETVVLNTCFGTRTNETLALLLSSLIASRVGKGIDTSTDAYRIIFDLPRSLRTSIIRDILVETPPEDVRNLLRVLVKNSPHAKWMLLYVAKKFGAIRKDADIKSINMAYLMRSYEGTLMIEEAIRQVLREHLDVDGTKKVLSGIRAGETDVIISGGLSPMAMEGLEGKGFLTLPSVADSTVLAALKARLMRPPAIFVCMHCHAFFHRKVAEVPERKKMKCSNCDGTYLAMLRDYQLETIRLLRKDRDKLTNEELKQVKRLNINASLISEYKRRAVLALMGRGIGPVKAARILAMPFYMEEDFLREILGAEIEYARTRRFWD